MVRAGSVAVVITLTATVGVQAQDCPVSESTIRELVKTTWAAHPNDESALLRAIDGLAKGTATGLWHLATEVHASNDLSIGLLPPYTAYRRELVEKMRKMEPLDDAIWVDAIQVFVSPRTLDAPDIVKIVVQRDGKVIEPTGRMLTPGVMTTRMGAKREIHSGVVLYPCSAFAPGATVKVTAIPETGDNIIKIFSSNDLVWLK
jgi:hypothetical protein